MDLMRSRYYACEWCETLTIQGCEVCTGAVCRECAHVDPDLDTFLCPQHAPGAAVR